MVVLTLKAKNDHLQRVASTRDSIKAIAEYVWNALDADATEISVDLDRTSLGGIVAIVIRDNGSGISQSRAEHELRKSGKSWKLHAARTAKRGRAIHGKEGQGRLRFYSLAQTARSTSVYETNEGCFQIKIEISADHLQNSSVTEPVPVPANEPTGTVVELSPLKNTFDWLGSEDARSEFNSTFAPYILQYPDVKIAYDQRLVDPAKTIEHSYQFPTKPIICPGRTVSDLTLRVIEWKSHIAERKNILRRRSGRRSRLSPCKRHGTRLHLFGLCLHALFQRDRQGSYFLNSMGDSQTRIFPEYWSTSATP